MELLVKSDILTSYIYRHDLVGVQIRWDKEGTVRAGDYNFHYGRIILR
jgi:hypothetical protein